ncbi:tail completion or Neck1 protein [Vibrio phage D294]
MPFSLGGEAIVKLARGLFEDPNGESKNTVSYVAEFNDSRSDNSASMVLTYTLKKPILEEELEDDFNRFFSKISSELGNDGADLIASIILRRQGFTAEDIKLSSQQGTLDISFDDTIADEVTQGVNVGVQPEKGRLLNQNTLKNLLETVMKENMLKVMTSGNAGTGKNSPLRNRTGRLVASSRVDYLTILNNGKDQKQTLSLYYKYMIYPYQVFDPVHTQSPQMNLASAARNPQKIIHDALAKAAKTLVGDRYTVNIRQVR